MSTQKSKPVYNTLPVKKDDGTIVHIKRVAASNMDTLIELQEKLVARYVDVDGAIGKIITDEEFISELTAMCSLLPLVEKTKTGEEQYLNYDDIKDNWEQLILLFLNGGLNLETRRNDNPFTPSKVSDLHFLPYLEILNRNLERVRKEKEDEKEKD